MEDDIDKMLKKIKEIVKKYKYIFFYIIILISIISVYKYIKNDKDIINISNTYKNTSSYIQDEKSGIKKIIVHIDGQVQNTGVYTLESDSRLNDLVNLAGGLTEQADSTKINLAKKLADGEKIYIYAIGEENIKEEVSEETNGKININKANKNELKQLPGIGDATADKIINYREENGEFETIDEIQKVNGIGESKYKNIQDLICT